MKRSQTLIRVVVFGLSLFLGVLSVQAADVIFEDGTTKAIGIKNLAVGGVLYDVTFNTQAFASEVYGPYPGTFTFEGVLVDEAQEEMIVALNVSDATSVGEKYNSYQTQVFNIGFEVTEVIGVNLVLGLRTALEGADWLPGGSLVAPYEFEDKDWAVFTAAGGGPPPGGDCQDDLDNGLVCLRNGRFQLIGEWTDFENPANTQPLIWTPVEDINATAGFQNNPSGIQIVLRIADGCTQTDSWWIWLGGFTDAGWDITVIDLVTEAEQTYTKERQGGVFPTTERDTVSFPCN